MTEQALRGRIIADNGMTDQAARTDFHPRWYRKRLSTWWWLGEWHYLTFILRELSSIAVAWFVVVTLFQLRALSNGAEPYARFSTWMHSPLTIAMNGIAFCFVVFHTITWFDAAPRAMPVRVSGKRVPEYMVAAPNYVLWIAVSAFVSWLLLRTP